MARQVYAIPITIPSPARTAAIGKARHAPDQNLKLRHKAAKTGQPDGGHSCQNERDRSKGNHLAQVHLLQL